METIKTWQERLFAHQPEARGYPAGVLHECGAAYKDAEIAELRAALAQRAASKDSELIKRLTHERNALGQAIADAAKKANIYNGDISLTGPHLIMLANDLAEADVHNFNICTHFNNWLLSKDALVTPHTEEDHGPLASAMNWIASVEKLIAAQRAASQDTVPTTVANQAINDALRLVSKDSERDAAQELDSLRIQVYAEGKRLVDDVLDPEDIEGIGSRLCELTKICDYCHGSGEDGDDADANGEGGWIGRCYKCGGSGIAAMAAQQSVKGGA